MSRKGKRKGKSFQAKPTPIDALIQARQTHHVPAESVAEQRLHAARSPLAPVGHR